MDALARTVRTTGANPDVLVRRGNGAPSIPFVSGCPPPPLERLNFYHGTCWSIAQRIPKNVKPLGRGDFAAGFYTHHDDDDGAALAAARASGMRIATRPPTERYAGVVVFSVWDVDYLRISANGKSKVFDLTRTDQLGYDMWQKEWIDFVTAHGREHKPIFRESEGKWIHLYRTPQPQLGYNVIKGPFYPKVAGKKGREPALEEFKPGTTGAKIPHQVVWANQGIDLLNSSNVAIELHRYDATIGDLCQTVLNL